MLNRELLVRMLVFPEILWLDWYYTNLKLLFGYCLKRQHYMSH